VSFISNLKFGFQTGMNKKTAYNLYAVLLLNG